MSAVDAVSREMPTQLSLTADISPWQDVTHLFRAAAKELKVGQLIHVDAFNLFDSMSALELMDPKMDAGCRRAASAGPPATMAQRLATGAIALRFSSASHVLATLDELWRCEAAWLSGQPLPQTLLTWGYLHGEPLHALLEQVLAVGGEEATASGDPTMLRETRPLEARLEAALALAQRRGSAEDTLLLVMATMALLTLATAHHVREVVVRADLYEEEDFSPASGFELRVLDEWSSAAIERLQTFTVQRLERLLSEQRTAAASKKSAKKKSKQQGKKTGAGPMPGGEGGLEGLHGNTTTSVFLCEALLRRVQLRSVLYSVYSQMGVMETLTDLQAAKDQFEDAQEILAAISTEALEIPAECAAGKPLGFDASISRQLLTGSPPREVTLPSKDDTIAVFRKLLQELAGICVPGQQWTSMEEVRAFLSDFSRKQPNILTRSYVLLLLYCDKKIYGQYSFMEWLTEEMVMNGVPSVLLSTQEGVHFSSRAIETVYESLKVYLHNRSRQRARIEFLLEEWSTLQLEAVTVDERFTTEMEIPKASYPRYFTAWTQEQVVQLMIQYVVLGFELELYAPSEYSTVYWYLDYLWGSRLQNLNFTWGFLQKMKEIMKDHGRGGGKTSGQTADADSSDEAQDPAKLRFQREICYTEMQRSMMRAYFQVFAAMERDDVIHVTPPVYGAAVIRFQHRFAAFQKLHFPAPLSHDDYVQNSDFARYGAELIYKSAEECFKSVPAHGEQAIATAITLVGSSSSKDRSGIAFVHAEEVEEIMKLALSNADVLARHEQDQQQPKSNRKTRLNGANATAVSSGTDIDYEFGSHPHFPTLRLTTDRRR